MASWAVAGLIKLGETKKKALDTAAEAAGLPRDELVTFRQGLIAPKRRGPRGALIFYDKYIEFWGEPLDERTPESELRQAVENWLDVVRATRDKRDN